MNNINVEILSSNNSGLIFEETKYKSIDELIKENFIKVEVSMLFHNSVIFNLDHKMFSKLKNINVLKIPSFYNGKKVTSLIIGNTDIKNFIFVNILYVPRFLVEIEGIMATKKYIVEKKNKHFFDINGVLYSYDIKKKFLFFCFNKSYALVNYPKDLVHNKYFVHPRTTLLVAFAFFKSAVKEVVLPSKLLTIYDQAFYDCKFLESLTIPNSVYFLEARFIFKCPIKSIYIPKNVKLLTGDILLSSCFLKEIKVDSKNKDFCDVDGVLYSKDKKDLIKYPEGRLTPSLVIPDLVESIDLVQIYNKDLKNLYIPKNVKIIDLTLLNSWACTKAITTTLFDLNYFFEDNKENILSHITSLNESKEKKDLFINKVLNNPSTKYNYKFSHIKLE